MKEDLSLFRYTPWLESKIKNESIASIISKKDLN